MGSSPILCTKTTLKDILKGVQTYRNERLVHLLDKLGYIENFGTDIPRTIEAYFGTGREPSFYDSENFFIVYLPNLNYNNNSNDQINDQISDIGLEILKIIQNNPGIKVQGIFDALIGSHSNITLDIIRNVIKREIKRYVVLKGSKKTGGYHIMK